MAVKVDTVVMLLLLHDACLRIIACLLSDAQGTVYSLQSLADRLAYLQKCHLHSWQHVPAWS